MADEFHPPLRPVLDKPLRLCVTDVFKGVGAGVTVSGMIHTGSIQAGDRIVAIPAGEMATVKGLHALNIFCIIDVWLKSGKFIYKGFVHNCSWQMCGYYTCCSAECFCFS